MVWTHHKMLGCCWKDELQNASVGSSLAVLKLDPFMCPVLPPPTSEASTEVVMPLRLCERHFRTGGPASVVLLCLPSQPMPHNNTNHLVEPILTVRAKLLGEHVLEG